MSEAPSDSQQAHPQLQALRQQLDQVDQQLLQLVAERQRIVAAIGASKQQQGRQLRDFERERQVLQQAVARGAELGLPATLCESLMAQLIEYSLGSQERGRLSHHAQGAGRPALVLGGLGRMGRWFADFLDVQGFAVSLADPAPAPDDVPYPLVNDWRRAASEAELIVLAAPMGATVELLQSLAELAPRGLIFDLGSLKSPLLPGLQQLASQGLRVVSVHPMFGPGTNMLSGRHVVLVDLGHAEALDSAHQLFSNTLAEVVTLSAADHDRLMAFVLSFSHLINIAFARVLRNSGEEALRLRRISSTSFEEQLKVARRIANENPQVYYEIQALNPHAAELRQQLLQVLSELDQIIRNEDSAGFTQLMDENRRFLEGVRRAPMAGDDGGVGG